jgi:hypothetical protein
MNTKEIYNVFQKHAVAARPGATPLAIELWMVEAMAEVAKATKKEDADSKRMDWLDKNVCSMENLDWNGNLVHGQYKWTFTAPAAYQGSARNIIDGAIKGN